MHVRRQHGPGTSPPTFGRARRVAAVAAAAVVLGSVPFVTPSATAAVPTFPDNLVVFPDRDFVTVEGYQDHIGETATVDIFRGATKIGSAQAVVQEGDVAFEINHPGGVCWGAGTALKVTPDIRGGDVAKISFGGQVAGDTKVLDAFATDVSYTAGTTTLTVSGHVGSDVVPAQMEQRIVNPSLVGTSVARRDVRAVPGPMTRAPRGGYSSALSVTGTTFTATYEFDEASVAKTAAEGGGARAMAWQEEDADANRQGLTIAELGEAGGPGMGGCPAGPADQAAPAGSFSAVRSAADKATYQVNWTAAAPQPGAAPVTGYSIEAIGPVDDTGAQKTVGARTGASATRTTLTVDPLVPAYTVEVRSIAGGRMSDAFTPVSAPPNAPPTDQTVPTVTASPAPNADRKIPVEATSVTLTSETGADIYYTTDGSAAVSSDLPADGAKLYTGPIPIAVQTNLHWVAFDRAGNFAFDEGTYAPTVTQVPPPTQLGAPTATAGQESVTLRWSPAPATQGVTTYGVQVYRGGVKDGTLKETEATQLTVTPLTAGTTYSFTVAAKNSAGYGPESGPSTATPTNVTDRVTITKATWKTGDFRIVGTGTVPGAIVNAYRVTSTGGVGEQITGGSATVAQPVAPSTVGSYDLRIRTGAPTANPGRIFVKSDKGSVAGPFSVTNG